MKKNLGIVFLALCICGIIYALIFKISVSGVDPMGTSMNRVVNLDLVQTKLTILIISCTLFISGIMCIVTSPRKLQDPSFGANPNEKSSQ